MSTEDFLKKHIWTGHSWVRTDEIAPGEFIEVPKGVDVKDILVERNNTHGDYAEQANLAQSIKVLMYESNNWERLNYVQRDAIEMIATKMSRIITGDCNHKDSWVDIAGYATLVANRLE